MTRTLFVFAALLAFSATATAAELDTANTEIVWRGSKITGKFRSCRIQFRHRCAHACQMLPEHACRGITPKVCSNELIIR